MPLCAGMTLQLHSDTVDGVAQVSTLSSSSSMAPAPSGAAPAPPERGAL